MSDASTFIPPKEKFLTEYEPDALPGLRLDPFLEHKSTSVDLLEDGVLTPVRNQLPYNTCSSFALAAVAETFYMQMAGTEYEFAAGWMHVCPGGDETSMRGLNLEFVDRELAAASIPLANQGPYPWREDQCAVGGAMRYPRTAKLAGVEAIKAALEAGTAVASGMFIDDEFGNFSGRIYAPNPASELQHAVAIVGFDASENMWLCKNSFGAGWGQNGYFLTSISGTNKIGLKFAAIGAVTTQMRALFGIE